MNRRLRVLIIIILVMAFIIPITACQRLSATNKEVDDENPRTGDDIMPGNNGIDQIMEEEQGKDNNSSYLALVSKNTGFSVIYGYVDQKGNTIIEPKYKKAQPFYACGVAIVTDQNDKVGLIDKKGNYLVEPQYNYIAYSEGLFLTSFYESNITIAFNEKGEKQFEITGYIGEFHEGLSPYYSQTERGYVDKTGKLSVKLNYQRLSQFSNGIAEVSENYDGPSYYIDTKGNDITDKVSSGLRMFKNEETKLFGYKDNKGSVVIDALYSGAQPFFNGFAIINASNDGIFHAQYGIIDIQGNFILEPVYCGIQRMKNGSVVVGEDIKSKEYVAYTYLNYSLKSVFTADLKTHTDWIYYLAEDFDEDYICVNDDTTVSFLDKSLRPAKSLPEFKGQGSFKKDGELLWGNLNYHQAVADLKGTVLARSDDRIDLGDGLEAVTNVEARDNTIVLQYPVIKGFKDEVLQKSINDSIKKEMVSPYQAYANRDPSNLEIVETKYILSKQKKLLLIDQSIYTDILGAAHGMSFRNTFYIDSTTCQAYGLIDLFKPDEKVFSYLSEVVSATMKKDMTYNEDHVTITPDTCFVLTEKGIILYFGVYEIASYAAGMPEFFIPFTDLTEYIDTQGSFWNSFS